MRLINLPQRFYGALAGSARWIPVLALLIAARPASLPANDWPGWRGPEQNGVSQETGLPETVDSVLWRIPVGARSTPVIHDGRVYLINLIAEGEAHEERRLSERERVMAVDLETGEILWEHIFSVFLTDVPNTRVGWTSCVVDPETGNVYAHGVQGLLYCFSRDGDILWSKSLTETLGRISGYGGRTQWPMIDEDRLVMSFLNSSFGDQGPGRHRWLALDKRTGDFLWWSTPSPERPALDTAYTVPVVSVINGQRMLLDGGADGWVYGLQARTGKKVWEFELSKRGINSSVVVEGGRVFATHSEENIDSVEMGRVVGIDATLEGDISKTGEVWRVDHIEAGYASPALHEGRLYVLDNSANLHCIDTSEGKTIWTKNVGRVGKGSPVFGDGKLFVPEANGRLTIVKDAGDEGIELSVFEREPEGDKVFEIHGSPAIADGRVVFANRHELICLGEKGRQPQAVEIPSLAPEAPADPDAPPATLLVRPAEVLIKPGESVTFAVSAYDDMGRFLRAVEAEWELEGLEGVLGADGAFTAAAQGGHAGSIVAKSGGLEAQARVRVVPDLPIEEDFEGFEPGDMISWWIGANRAKHAIEKVDDSVVLKKLADDRGPAFNRSNVFITPPLEAGYTVQADVMGTQVGRRRGDVGLINARYQLELIGVQQRLRVNSWVPGPRFEERMDFAWEPDTWYTMKFRVDIEDGKGMVRGKVWPRGESEPEAWTLEAVDPYPNTEGSGGICANSFTPVFHDNVSVRR